MQMTENKVLWTDGRTDPPPHTHTYAVEQLVEALRYKPEGREFDSQGGHWNSSVT
jgi:hypothetical protein